MSKIGEQLQPIGWDPFSISQWYAAFTATHHEKRVHKQLADHHIESFLPLYSVRRHWKKRTPEIASLPLFPNYIFVRITRAQRSAVLATPGIYSLVGSGQKGWELPEGEIEALRNGLKDRRVQPHPYLVVGERARIRYGILAGLEGVIVRRKANLNMVLTLDQIERSIAIEVESDELEPIVGIRPPSGIRTGGLSQLSADVSNNPKAVL